MLLGDFQHVTVNTWILVTSEAEETCLARLLCGDERRVRSFLVEDAMRILETQDLVMLDQVDVVCLQTPQRLIELFRCLLLCTTVDLGHKKGSFAITIAQCLAHAPFTGAVVVIPTVVHEVDAAINRGTDQANTQLFVDRLEAQVPATEADKRYLHSRAT